MSKLAQKIAGARQEMIVLGAKYGLNSTPVLKASERLDALLNEYQAISTHESRAIRTAKHP